MTELVTLGECLVSLVASRPGPLSEAIAFDRFVAGAEANVAVGLARLGHEAAFIGRVGPDGFGETIRRHLRGEGVDTAHLTTDPDAPTGVMVRERPGLIPAQVLYLRRGSAGSRLTVDDVCRQLGWTAARAREALNAAVDQADAWVDAVDDSRAAVRA